MDKIDANGDGEVSEQELIDWIKKAQSKYLEEEVQRQWEVSAVPIQCPTFVDGVGDVTHWWIIFCSQFIF